MRIIWADNQFQAEISLHADFWKDDVELLKSAKFRTDGPPNWKWTASGIAPLDYLRKHTPKSGLTITELALEKYTALKQQSEQKSELKKQFKKAQAEAAAEVNSANWKDYIDEETGIVCKVVEPLETEFKMKYVRPAPPEVFCFQCGDPVYWYEFPDMCLFCWDQEKTLDKKSEL